MSTFLNKKYIFLLAIIFIIPFKTEAATYTWDGGGVDNNWSTCANWSSDICPLTTDSVIFSGTSVKNADIDSDITVAGFSINSGYSGVIAPLASQLITINGAFTQSDGTFTVSVATTTVTGNFTYTAGTFNHNNGIIAFNNPAGSGQTITPNSAVFNDVVLDMPGNIPSASYTTSLGSNMTINGDLYVQNTNTNSGFYTFRSSSSVATRTIALAGDFIVPSTSGTATVFLGATSAAYPINVILQGNMTLADSNTQLYLDITFASSSNQTITKTTGTIDATSDWYDTGSGSLILTANFSGSQKLNSDSLDDFSFVSSGAYTFTSGSAAINTGTTWAPDGPSSYIFSSKVVLSTGTFNAPADSAFNGGLEMTGGVFNAPSGMLTIKTNQSYEGFVITSGTFNHNNGTILFYPNSSGMAITPNGTNLYNVIFDYITSSSNTSNIGIGSDMNILGSMTLQNNQPSTGLLKIRSSVSGTPRTITIAGDLMIASTSPSSTSIFFGESTPGTYVLNTTLYGNMSINDSASIYANITFASSSNQTFSKTAGAFATGSTVTINKPYGTALVLLADLYSTGSVNVVSGTLRTSGYAVTTAASSFTVGATGNLEIIGYEALTAPTLSTGSFVTYAGATSTTYALKNYSYKNLTIQSTGTTYSVPAALTIAQNINIASGTLDVTASNYALNIAGNWANTGTFTPRSGTVTLNGTNQSITGTSTFYNLTKSVVVADTLTFGADQTQTISNIWTANGASGNLLSLRSNITGTQWKVNPQNTRTLSYIDVKDSNNTNATVIGSIVGVVDSRNNTNWGFDTNAPEATSITVTPTTTTANISWITDENATSTFKYGLTSSYGTASTSLGTTVHSVDLSGLTSGTVYHYAIVSSDSIGNTATTTDAIFTTLDNTVPIVSLTSPSEATIVSGTSVSLTATASDDVAVAGVQFKLDTNTNIGSEDTTSTYGVTWDSTGVADGAHTLIAVARDETGNYATSSIITVTIDNTAPELSDVSPGANLPLGTTEATISVTTNENSTCKYSLVADTVFGSMTSFETTGNTLHSQVVSGLSDNISYNYYVKCSDSQGNTNNTDLVIAFTVSVDESAPVISNIISTPSISSVQITWSTNEDADTQIEYGLTTSYGSYSEHDTNLVSEHTVTIAGLLSNTTYHYRAVSSDIATNTASSSDQVFTTLSQEVTRSNTYGYNPIKKSDLDEKARLTEIINYLLEQIKKQTLIKAPATITPSITPIFTKDLSLNLINDDVRKLQKFLNSKGFVVASFGPGSVGNETTKFGSATKSALIKFQIANGIKPALGYFGPATRLRVNSLLTQ